MQLLQCFLNRADNRYYGNSKVSKLSELSIILLHLEFRKLIFSLKIGVQERGKRKLDPDYSSLFDLENERQRAAQYIVAKHDRATLNARLYYLDFDRKKFGTAKVQPAWQPVTRYIIDLAMLTSTELFTTARSLDLCREREGLLCLFPVRWRAFFTPAPI